MEEKYSDETFETLYKLLGMLTMQRVNSDREGNNDFCRGLSAAMTTIEEMLNNEL